MNIIVPKRTLVFTNHGNGAGLQEMMVKPANGVQVVPDWIADTPTFKAAVTDGSVAVVGTIQAPPVVEKAPDQTEEQRKALFDSINASLKPGPALEEPAAATPTKATKKAAA